MLTNYLKLAWRTLTKQKLYSAIIVSGLALAYTACIIIFLFVKEETSYDKQPPDYKRIYRVVKDFINDDGSTLPDATSPPAMAVAIQRDISQVESVVRVFSAWGTKFLVRNGDISFFEPRLFRADSNVFEFFSFEMIHGNPATALKESNSIVINESTANKYFGTTDVLGRNLQVGEGDNSLRVVTGVIKDLPANMHFHFDLVVPFWPDRDLRNNWNFYNFYTYIKLREGVDISEVEPQIVATYEKNVERRYSKFYTQALSDIHLTSKLKWEMEPNGDKSYIVIFTTVGIFILLIAAVNYINLSIVQSLNRSKEVGIRKVSGANTGKLVSQFLLESFVVSFVSFVLSLAVVEAITPMINVQFENNLSSLYDLSAPTITSMILVALGVALLSGLYPALYLSAFKPVQVLKGIFQPSHGNLWLRKGLVVLQFSISIALIAGALVVFMQVDYLRNKELGFDKDQIVIVENVQDVTNKASLRESFSRLPGVTGVGASNGVLGGQNWVSGMTAKGNQSGALVNMTGVDYDYLDVMGVELVAGRKFVKGTDIIPQGTSAGLKLVLNEQAVKELGITGDPVGALITTNPNADSIEYMEVVGVAKDFHFASLKSEIKPYVFYLRDESATNFVVKVEASKMNGVIAELRETWIQQANGRPFEFYFLDDQFKRLYKAEENFRLIFAAFTGMAIYIACSGLFAIASFFIRRRTKEIGIRKVLGASGSQITWLVSAEFLVIVAIANVIAWPVAWKFMNEWLNGFAYRVELSIGSFIIAAVAGILIAMLTVGFHSLKAAGANPVNSLRNE